MKKTLILIVLYAMLAFSLCSCMDTGNTQDQGHESASTKDPTISNIGDYHVIIESCRLATDYEGKPIVIVKYKFTNNSSEPASFEWSVVDRVYQNGVGLNRCYFVDESEEYSDDNQTKEIKQGVSLYVEVAYELNDETTDIEVEVSGFIYFTDKKVTKTFSID